MIILPFPSALIFETFNVANFMPLDRNVVDGIKV
jgi:hypothetical protein